ncbi:MAG: SRPBCC family protein [Myxococcota bacterium]
MSVVAKVTIAAPAKRVWTTLTSPRDMACWMGGVSDLTFDGDGLLRLGSRISFTTRGRTVESEVIAFEALHRLAFRSRQGPVEATYTYLIRGHEPVTLTHEIDCIVRGFARIFRPLIVGAIRRSDGPHAERVRALSTA